jgi:hypothetical protein
MRRLLIPMLAAAYSPAAAPVDAQVPGLSGTLIVTNKTPSTATIIDVASGRALATLQRATTLMRWRCHRTAARP